MKEFIKTLALFVISFLLVISFAISCNAQINHKKAPRPTMKRRINSRAGVSTRGIIEPTDNACLVSQNKPKPEIKKNNEKAKNGYLISDCEPMNLTAIYQPTPSYPKAASTVAASGLVSVNAVIDEDGKVIWAKVIQGHPLLQTEASRTACRTRFKPVTDCHNQRLKLNTVLNYNFKKDD